MIVLIDACVVVDVLQNREPFSKSAMEIFIAASERKFVGVLTAKSITDIFYILHRSLKNEAEARSCINKLFMLFSVEDTFAMDCKNALDAPVKDYEDAVMIETAKRIGADYIFTRNLKDYTESEIPVLSPAELLDVIYKEE